MLRVVAVGAPRCRRQSLLASFEREALVPRTDQETTEPISGSHIDTDAVLAAIEFLLDMSADLSRADRGVLLRAARELLDLSPDPWMRTVPAAWLAEPILALSV